MSLNPALALWLHGDREEAVRERSRFTNDAEAELIREALEHHRLQARVYLEKAMSQLKASRDAYLDSPTSPHDPAFLQLHRAVGEMLSALDHLTRDP